MNSVGLQQNFILFVENKNKEANLNRRLCCEKCRFSTKDTDLFERHVAHHEEVTFSCTLCSHVSYSRVESQRHSVKHKGSFPYRCNWCDYGAVRRDYMVKHIQRIHGKTADVGFTTDCSLPTTKIEHLSQNGTTGLCPDTQRKFVSCSTGKKSSRCLGVSQSGANAPYIVAKPVHQMSSNQTVDQMTINQTFHQMNSNKTHLIYRTANQSVTSTACILPITKTQVHHVAGTAHAVTKFTSDINNQQSVIVDEAGQNASKTTEYNNRPTGKMSLEKNVSPSALPRVHFGIYADCPVQQRPLLQGHVKGTTEKMVIQSKTIPKLQVGLPVGNNAHLKTFLSNTLESVAHRTAEVRNVVDAPAGQRPVHSGAVRNIPVVHEVHRSVPSGVHPSMSVEQFKQGTSSNPHETLNTEMPNRRTTQSNVLVKPPLENFKSLTQSSIQVELLAPLNQPIQHNRPLTVSCPEEITIPAGCLVELVEVKNVSGTRELELRLVPQLPGGPHLGGPMSTTAPGTPGRLSFKCRVTTEDDQPTSLDRGVCVTQENGVPESQAKESHRNVHSTDITVTIKDEPEVNERVLCSKTGVTQASGSSNAGFQGTSKSVAKPASNPSESQRFFHQPCTVTNSTELVTPVLQMHNIERTMFWSATSKNITAESVGCDTNAQASPNKHDDAESSSEGLPVISSVFSLCPVPEATLNHIHTRVGILDKGAGEALTSSDLGSNGNVKNREDLGVCRHDLKTEEETGSLTKIVQKSSQKLKENDDKPTINEEDTKIFEGAVSQTLGDMLEKSSQTCVSDLKNKIILEQCSILSDARGTVALLPASKKSFNTQPSKKVKTKLEANNSLPVQSESSHTLSMNPTVALVRIPSLEFYSVLEPVKKISEKLVEEESITARPVLCCTSNQQNLQETAIKLILKRKRSDTENKVSERDLQPGLSHFDIHHKKRKKEKKSAKKHKSPKVRLDFQQILQKSKMAKLWLSPLKEDQLVKIPGPNQPVVVLNHPNPLVQMVSTGVQTLKDYKWIASAHGFCSLKRAQPVRQCPSFIMKLKKVQGQKYQVTELVLKGVSEKMIL